MSMKNRFNEQYKIGDTPYKRGLWLSLIGDADEQREGSGPPQRAATDIVTVMEQYFEILTLESSHFGSKRSNPPRAWVC